MTGMLLSRFSTLKSVVSAAGLEYVGGKSTSFVGDTTTANISLTDLSGGTGSEPIAGDYVVVGYGITTQNRTPTLTITGDNYGAYDLIAGPAVGDATFDTRLYARGARMGSPPDSLITRSATGNIADDGAIVIHVWRGTDPTTPLDVTANTAGGTPARPNPPAITPVTNGAVIITIGAGVSNSAWNTPTYLDNFFQELSVANFFNNGIGSLSWSGGTYDPAAWTGGWGSATYAAITLALRPES